MNVCDVLVRLDDEILTDESKWCKYYLVDADERVCLIGGITKAVYGDARARVAEDLISHPRDLLMASLYRETVKAISNETPTMAHASYFNDLDSTTFDDVKAIIKSARQNVCAKEEVS